MGRVAGCKRTITVLRRLSTLSSHGTHELVTNVLRRTQKIFFANPTRKLNVVLTLFPQIVKLKKMTTANATAALCE